MPAKSNKKTRLPNDLERMIPEYHKPSFIYGEHIVRYTSAKQLVKDKVVLDIASGSGYGAVILAEKAKKVIGVDVSKESIQYSKENYSAKNIEYVLGNGTKIPLDDNSVDAVVSFETIEHIADYKKFLDEIRRVLKADGLCIISTPNDLEFSEGNHFHLHQFKYEELHSLLNKYFKYVESYYQGTWVYSALMSGKMLNQEFQKNINTIQAAPIDKKQCIYFFMVCANRSIIERPSYLGVISEHWSARQIQEKQKLTDNHIQNIKNIAGDKEEQIQLKKAELVSKNRHIDELSGELHQILNSKSWKLLTAGRRIKNKFKISSNN